MTSPEQPTVNDLIRRPPAPPAVQEDGPAAELLTLAAQARAINPATVARLLAAEPGTDREAALRALRRSDPYLFGYSSAGGGEGRDGNSDPPGDHAIGQLLRSAAGQPQRPRWPR